MTKPINIFDLTVTGLMTGYGYAPKETWCGMRPRADHFMMAAMGLGHRVGQFVHGWHEFAKPEQIADRVIAQWRGGMNGEPYNMAIARGHSFGADWLFWFCNRLTDKYAGTIKFARLVGYDGADNWARTGTDEWQLPETTVERALYIYQRAGRPAMVKGRPLPDRPALVSYDVTHRTRVLRSEFHIVSVDPWGDGPQLDHCSLIVDPESVKRVDAFTFAALADTPKSSAAATEGGLNDSSSASGPAPSSYASVRDGAGHDGGA